MDQTSDTRSEATRDPDHHRRPARMPRRAYGFQKASTARTSISSQRSLGDLRTFGTHGQNEHIGDLHLQATPIGRSFTAGIEPELPPALGPLQASNLRARPSLPALLKTSPKSRPQERRNHATPQDLGDKLAFARNHRETSQPSQPLPEASEHLAKLTAAQTEKANLERVDSVTPEPSIAGNQDPQTSPLFPRITVEEAPAECRDDMATGYQRMSGDARRYPSSNSGRNENRPPMNNVLCRNGPQCRKFQEGARTADSTRIASTNA